MKRNDTAKTVEDCTIWSGGISKDMFINMMKCVKNLGNITDNLLASKYLHLYEECLTKFDSCFYTDFRNVFDCTCPYFYIVWIKPLKMKLGECKKWNKTYLVEIVGPAEVEFGNDVKYLEKRISELSCISSSRKWNPIMAKLKMAEKSRSINTEVCTCGPDGCDESAANKVTFKPDEQDESTENTAFPGSSNGNHQTINYCFNLK